MVFDPFAHTRHRRPDQGAWIARMPTSLSWSLPACQATRPCPRSSA